MAGVMVGMRSKMVVLEEMRLMKGKRYYNNYENGVHREQSDGLMGKNTDI